MVVTNSLLADVKDAALDRLESVITNVEVSTNTTAPTASDTSQGGTTKNETAFSTSRGASSFSASMFLDVTEFNGNTINKAGTKTSGGTLYSSSLTNAIAKNSNTEVFVEVKNTVNAVNV